MHEIIPVVLQNSQDTRSRCSSYLTLCTTLSSAPGPDATIATQTPHEHYESRILALECRSQDLAFIVYSECNKYLLKQYVFTLGKHEKSSEPKTNEHNLQTNEHHTELAAGQLVINKC